MKEWLGLTEEINSWSDFFHTRLGRILTTVGAIAIGLAAWKISRGVISALETIKTLQKAGLGNALTLSIGISLTIGGIALEAAGIIDAIQNELNGMNFAQISLATNYAVADGSMFFLPCNGVGVRNTGYVSAEISNEQCEFETNPKVTIRQEVACMYYGASAFQGTTPA